MNRSADSQALLLLCSHLGLPPDSQPAPLKLSEWNRLSQSLPNSPLKRPGALLGLAAADIAADLGLSNDEAERRAALLARGAALAFELERLESLGIWAVTRIDDEYPERLRERLKDKAPPVLFGSGDISLAGRTGLAVVGSRNVGDAGRSAAEFLGRAAAACGMVAYSGGAKGVDQITVNAALEEEGQAVGVLADSLERAVRPPETREALAAGKLTLCTPYSPKAAFNVGNAMGRNKLIYTLADYGVVVASDAEAGGTWNGAVEALKAHWIPVFVCDGPEVPEGNRMLLQKGALPFPLPFDGPARTLKEWLGGRAGEVHQRTLF